MNFKNFFFTSMINPSYLMPIDMFIEKHRSGELDAMELINQESVDVIVGFDENMVFGVIESSQSIFDNEPLQAAIKALQQAIEALPLHRLISYGLVHYKNKSICANKSLHISVIYSEIPNIIPYSMVTNTILLRHYVDHLVDESIDQITKMSTNLGTITSTSTTSTYSFDDGSTKKISTICESKWNVVSDFVFDESMKKEVLSILNK